MSKNEKWWEAFCSTYNRCFSVTSIYKEIQWVLLQCSQLRFWSFDLSSHKNRYLKLWCGKTVLNLILWFRWALSVAKRNWEVKLNLPIHKFDNYGSYNLTMEVLFTIVTHEIYHTKLYNLEYIIYITYFCNRTKSMKTNLPKIPDCTTV